MGAITVGHVIAAAADITGVEPARLVAATQMEPLNTYRRCAQFAALRCGVPPSRIWRAFNLHSECARRREADAFLERHADTITAIVDRARALADECPPAPVPLAAPVPSAAAVLVAAERVTRSSVRDIIGAKRAQPWTDYRICAIVAARQVGVPRENMAAALNRAPHTLSRRAGWYDDMLAVHGDTIRAIADMAVTLSQQHTAEALRNMLRRPIVSVPSLDKYGRFPVAAVA